MTLDRNGVETLKRAARIALDSGKLKTDEHARMLELYYRAADALENWTWDEGRQAWSIRT